MTISTRYKADEQLCNNKPDEAVKTTPLLSKLFWIDYSQFSNSDCLWVMSPNE